MRQNAPNPISISIFPGVTPRSPGTGGSAPDPWEGREGGEGREGKGRGGKGEEGGREGEGEVCVIAVGEIDAPG